MIDEGATPWLTVPQAATRAQCGRQAIYGAIAAGKLKAARLGKRREWRIHVLWLDGWIEAAATVVNPEAPGPAVLFRPRRRGRAG